MTIPLAPAVMSTTTAAAAEFTGFPPREQTLIVEPDGDIDPVPGQHNPYMTGTPASFGLHQLVWVDGLWDTNTIDGSTIPLIASELATPNADFTEWTIKIRDGLKWSDGEALDANDVYFTFMMIMTDSRLTDNPYYNSIFSGAELIDDLTLKISCHQPFPRIMTTLGVNSWGCGFRTVPEHIFKDVDVPSFMWTDIISADAYTLKDYDPLGTWKLYEKRADWADTPTGKAFGEPVPQYVLYRVFGSQEARVMAMINNEVDVMNEVAYEDFKVMLSRNENVRAWYKDFPYASTDDACGKGVMFNMGVEPFNNVDVRWALTLCCDHIEVSKNIFEGIGRMSALTIPAVMVQELNYYRPMSDWLTNDLKISGDYNPWNPNFALELAPALEEEFGYNLSAYSDSQLIDIFGSGYWKTDKEKATSLLEGAGFTLVNGRWNKPDGAPWVIAVMVHPEEGSTQANRSARAIADQWEKFGIGTDVTTVHSTDLGTRVNLGEFEAVSTWPWCSNYRMDFYNNISGWNFDVYNFELGELATGISAYRLPQADPELASQISKIIQKLGTLDPNGPEVQPLTIEFMKLAIQANSGIQVHAGTKLVPVNETYWTGFPTSENPYEGPWWWWSLFRGIVTNLSAK
jgi:peptide/nickel transport system substrate-binding protein